MKTQEETKGRRKLKSFKSSTDLLLFFLHQQLQGGIKICGLLHSFAYDINQKNTGEKLENVCHTLISIYQIPHIKTRGYISEFCLSFYDGPQSTVTILICLGMCRVKQARNICISLQMCFKSIEKPTFAHKWPFLFYWGFLLYCLPSRVSDISDWN